MLHRVIQTWVFMSVLGVERCISTAHKASVSSHTHAHIVVEPGSLDGGTGADVNRAERLEGPQIKGGKDLSLGQNNISIWLSSKLLPAPASCPAPPLCCYAEIFHPSRDEMFGLKKKKELTFIKTPSSKKKVFRNHFCNLVLWMLGRGRPAEPLERKYKISGRADDLLLL